MVQAASLNVNLTAGVAGFEAGMKRATSMLSNFGKAAGRMSTAFTAASAAVRVPMLAMTKDSQIQRPRSPIYRRKPVSRLRVFRLSDTLVS